MSVIKADVKTAIAKATPFEPEGLEQAIDLAARLARSGLLPSALRGKPDDVLVIMLTGRGLGLDAMQSLRMIYVVEGRPSLSAEAMRALCLARPDVCQSFRMVESTDTRCTWEALRRGEREPSRVTWTIQDAQRAGLVGRGPWKSYPAAMLRARASADLARAVFPDLVGGLVASEELDEIRATGEGERFAPPPAPAAPPPARAVVDVQPEAPAPAAPPPARAVVDVETSVEFLETAIECAQSVEELRTLVEPIKALLAADPQRGLAVKHSYAVRREALSAPPPREPGEEG
jgi:hypothetical protein